MSYVRNQVDEMLDLSNCDCPARNGVKSKLLIEKVIAGRTVRQAYYYYYYH